MSKKKIDINKPFAEKLAEAMANHGLTQAALAEKMNVSQGTVSGWLNGRLPHKRVMRELIDLLGIPFYMRIKMPGQAPYVEAITDPAPPSPKAYIHETHNWSGEPTEAVAAAYTHFTEAQQAAPKKLRVYYQGVIDSLRAEVARRLKIK